MDHQTVRQIRGKDADRSLSKKDYILTKTIAFD